MLPLGEEGMKENKEIAERSNIDKPPCECFPSHCEKFEIHGICWCDPDVLYVKNDKIFIHRGED
jgi:hypothetical protein